MSAILNAKTFLEKCVAYTADMGYKKEAEEALRELTALKSELEVADAEMKNLRNHAYVWAGSAPFSGQEVLALLKENEELRKQLAALMIDKNAQIIDKLKEFTP